MARSGDARWDSTSIGDLTGRLVVVTGGNSGVGFEAARGFASHGATVLIACRNLDRARSAQSRLGKGGPPVRIAQLDVSDLDSVRAFVAGLCWDHVDILVNNAGVMGGPPLRSAQGFDTQVATNHLGPFALTAQMWPLLTKSAAGRVVNVSSLAARGGTLSGSFDGSGLKNFEPYREMDVYAITKQANLLFTVELARRTRAAGSTVTTAAAHPGLARTNLFERQLIDQGRRWLIPFMKPVYGLAFQSARAGAWPLLRAATDPPVPNGGFVGPHLFGGTRGAATVIPLFPPGNQADAALALWQVSEQLTGVAFAISGPSA